MYAFLRTGGAFLLALALAFALAAVVPAAAATSAVDVNVCTNCTLPFPFQICYNGSFAENGPSLAEIAATCGGPVLGVGCARISDGLTMQAGALAPRADVLGVPSAAAIGNGSDVLFYNDQSLSVTGFHENSGVAIPLGCGAESAPASLCRQLSANGRIQPGGRCGGVSYSISAMRYYVFSSPCYEKTASDPCVSTDGACGIGATCDAPDGVCTPASVTNCTGVPNQCQDDLGCDVVSGDCLVGNKTAGVGCDGGDPCLVGSQCDGGGGCTPGIVPVACPGPQPCYDFGTCNATSNTTFDCVYEPLPAGSVCNNGDACTTGDTCLFGNGSCIGVPRVFADYECRKDAVCVNGAANYTWIAPDGTNCTDELGSCAETGQCLSGVCQPVTFVDCGPINCFTAGVCQGGFCVNRTQLAAGTPCLSPNGCAATAACTASAQCQPVTFQSCPAPAQCFLPAVCTSTGTGTYNCTSNPANGQTCDIDQCTIAECLLGSCVPIGSVACPGDTCNDPTTCSTVTGCSNPKPDGTPCSTQNGCATGECQTGTCVITSPCAAPVVESILL
jgi:hypothetical protein